MSLPIEDYALIGDLHTAALVSSAGSVDWLCLPRFDSAACFAALLGNDRHGHWRISPADGLARVQRRYLPDTLVLQTEFATASGTIRLTDCMPPRRGDPVLLRVLEGVSGEVTVRMTLRARFEYGSAQPAVSRSDGAYRIVAGPEALWLFGPLRLGRGGGTAAAEFRVSAGDRIPLAAVWRPAAHGRPGRPPQVAALAERTVRWWRDWVAGLDVGAEWREAVTRSLITIKALTYAPTGGLVGAPTSSLPRQASGAGNRDYRYCFIADAADAMAVLLRHGAAGEAGALLGWICRAVAGPPGQVQARYGVAGERWLPEVELDWLPGYEGARPVRIGSAAAARPHLAVFGEVMRARLAARMAGRDRAGDGDPWRGDDLLDFLESRWREPDPGIWEAPGPPRQFVHSKLMAWAAADAAVKMIEKFAEPGPADRWRRLRAKIRADALRLGYDAGGQKFVQCYAGSRPDASLLRIAELGFLPPADRRVRGTFAAIGRELDQGGVLLRYRPEPLDGLTAPPGEGGYLPATFWLAQGLALMGREADARRVFSGVLALRNDVGLLAGYYDPLRGRLAGNYPLAASHIALAAAAGGLDPARAGVAASVR